MDIATGQGTSVGAGPAYRMTWYTEHASWARIAFRDHLSQAVKDFGGCEKFYDLPNRMLERGGAMCIGLLQMMGQMPA